MKLPKEVYEGWSFGKLIASGLFSSKLLGTIEGSVMGDASLPFTGKQARLRVGLSREHLDTLEDLQEVLAEIEPDIREPYFRSDGAAQLDTCVHPLYTWFFHRWYHLEEDYKGRLGLGYRYRVPPKKGECWKILPEDVAITPTVLFWEHVFDGNLYWKKNGHGFGRSPEVYFATSCFTFEEADYLNRRIGEETGLPFKTYRQTDGRTGRAYPTSYLLKGNANAPRFFNYIGSAGLPCPDSYRYKFSKFEGSLMKRQE